MSCECRTVELTHPAAFYSQFCHCVCALHKQPLLFGVAVHSYAVHKYLLKDSDWCFQAWYINLIWVLSLVILRGTCHFLHSHVCHPWNEQNGSENERITIKLHPKSANRLMSIRGANFRPSKIHIISVLRCSSYLLPAAGASIMSYRMCGYWRGSKDGGSLKIPCQ